MWMIEVQYVSARPFFIVPISFLALSFCYSYVYIYIIYIYIYIYTYLLKYIHTCVNPQKICAMGCCACVVSAARNRHNACGRRLEEDGYTECLAGSHT